MIEDLAKVQKAESDVQDAIRLMTNDHDPAGCLRKLDLIQLSLLPDSATKQDLESRVRRARGMGHYLVDRKSLVDGIKDTAAKARFFEKYPRPPEGTEPDIVAWHGKESLRTQLEKFAGAEDLTGLLTKAAAIVGDEYADASIKARVKQEVVKWLKSKAFTRKTVPDGLVGMEEAWTRRGDRKIGKFRLNGVQYRFWRWDGPLNITDNPLGEDAFDADSFERAPSTPMYTLWADEYNSRIDQLFLPDTTRARWDEFLRWCKDTEAKLKEYRQRWGIIQEPDRSCRDWTFLHETSIPAEDIQQHWENLRKVLQ